MKKNLCIVLAFAMAFLPVSTAAASYYYNGSNAVKYTKGAYKAYYDNKLVTGLDNEPAVLINDNIMIPYKQSLIDKGPKLSGSYKNKVIVLRNKTTKVTMKLDNRTATITNLLNNTTKTNTLNTPPKKVKYNGHTAIYVPAKKIAAFFGLSYAYKKETKSVYMSHIHAWGSYHVTKKETCTKEGFKTRTCSGCGKEESASISATGHKWSAYTTTKKATCGAEGAKTRKCSECGKMETATISALAHKWNNGKITWGSDGLNGNKTVYTCSVCKGTKKTNGIQSSTFLSMTKQQFFDTVGKLAKAYYKKQKNVGVLPSITVAQAIQESGYGTTDLAQGGNNIFGMKINLSGNNWVGTTWDGKSYFEKESWESYGGKRVLIRSRFRKYPCIEDNIADHAMYLFNAKNGSHFRYNAMRKKGVTYIDQLNSLVNGGYCTFGTYTNSLKKHINNYGLAKYDK